MEEKSVDGEGGKGGRGIGNTCYRSFQCCLDGSVIFRVQPPVMQCECYCYLREQHCLLRTRSKNIWNVFIVL